MSSFEFTGSVERPVFDFRNLDCQDLSDGGDGLGVQTRPAKEKIIEIDGLGRFICTAVFWNEDDGRCPNEYFSSEIEDAFVVLIWPHDDGLPAVDLDATQVLLDAEDNRTDAAFFAMGADGMPSHGPAKFGELELRMVPFFNPDNVVGDDVIFQTRDRCGKAIQGNDARFLLNFEKSGRYETRARNED